MSIAKITITYLHVHPNKSQESEGAGVYDIDKAGSGQSQRGGHDSTAVPRLGQSQLCVVHQSKSLRVAGV